MRHAILLLVLAAAGCSENPLDPDHKGQIKSAFDDVANAVGGNGGDSGPTCEQVCDKLSGCCNEAPYAFCGITYEDCLNQCNPLTAQQRQAYLDATCEAIDQAVRQNQGG
jgi:hypothetical protein